MKRRLFSLLVLTIILGSWVGCGPKRAETAGTSGVGTSSTASGMSDAPKSGGGGGW